MNKFSVIVVCYEAGEKLKNTIKSILDQTYDNYEVIVKDGMSTDGSVETVKERILDTRVIIKQEPDRGIYDAMNQGIAYATGAYILFLNCGDVFYNTQVLAHVSEGIEANPNQGIYYGDVHHGGNNTLEPMPHSISPFTCYRHMPCHQAIFYDKKLFETRGYDTQYKIRGDYEHFLWAYFKMGICPVHVGCTIATYEGGGYSESKENGKRDQQEHSKITALYLPKGKLFLYRSIMMVTLAPLRGWMARNRYLGSMYSNCKKVLYRKA